MKNGDTAAALAAEVSASPPHETKVRLISRGVKDLNWKSLAGASAKLAFGSAEEVSSEPTEMDHEDEKPAQDASAVGVEVIPQGLNPPVVNDGEIGAEEHSGGSDPAEVPPLSEQPESGPAQTSRNTSPAPFPGSAAAEASNPSPPPSPPSSGSPRTAPLLPSAIEEDIKSGQKRKLGDRTVSERHLPGDMGERKGKRVSPPPAIEEADEPGEKRDVAKPKPVSVIFESFAMCR